MDLLDELNRCVYPDEYTLIDLSDEDQRAEAIDTFADYYKYNDYNQTIKQINTFYLNNLFPLEMMTELYENLKTSTNRANFDIVSNVNDIYNCISIVLHFLYTSMSFGNHACKVIPIEEILSFCDDDHLSRVTFYIQFVASVLIYAEEYDNNAILK